MDEEIKQEKKGQKYLKLKNNYIVDDKGRLYFFSDINNESDLLQRSVPSFPSKDETKSMLDTSMIEILFMDLARKRISKDVFDTSRPKKGEFETYDRVVIKYDLPADVLNVVTNDISENLLWNEPIKTTPKTAWFCVQLKSNRYKSIAELNSEMFTTSLPHPNSSSCDVTFLNGKIRAVCIDAVLASKAKASAPTRNKVCRVLLEFTEIH